MTTTALQKIPGRKLIPGADDLDEQESAAVKAIRAWESFDNKVRAYEREHAAIFSEYFKLAQELERKRKVADAAIRATDASYGPWERFSEKKTYDVPLLYEKLGHEKFIELGGSVDEMTVYNFDRDKLEIQITAKKIPKAIATDITTVTPNYRSPKPLKVGAGG